MNTKSLNKIKEKFNSLLTEENEEEGIEHDVFILMAGYLSEIERIQKKWHFTRRDLAKKINTSPSYLTQVFRGDKPLNFYTLAKIQRSLNIRFNVSAYELSDSLNSTKVISMGNLEKVPPPILDYSEIIYSTYAGETFSKQLNKSTA